MNKIKLYISLVTIGLILLSVNSYAQTKEELQNRKQKTEESIKLTNKLLEKTEKIKSGSLNKLLILNKRISLRNRLIQEIALEINLLNKSIDEKSVKIVKLENEIKQLKEEYAKMIYYAYKNRNSNDKLMFILAAENFNQAYRRMKYFQQYSEYRKKQAKQIVISQKNLEYEIEQLKEERAEKVTLLSRKERENAQLTTEKENKNNEVRRLKRKEKDLKKKIRKEEKIRRDISNAIAELIAKEAKTNKTYKTLSANEEIISQGFKSSKGKLRWPVGNGIIIGEFGEHPHPVIKGIKIKNDGIDIGTTSDNKVKTIYKGEVTKVFAVPGANMIVIVRHGHYLSLYSNIV
ncbi:MAG: hypothetical protein KAQ75_08025, partial [Bacteroidales bacterium]|nr:hypothetical protein [Bacteroidales bacterium]